ncbi:MAG TPA: nuclear transport factor 2 family protein [Saprospiraceae bacterium]|nr:nuclear transport factor 2 family protein [Saprospiraceae bacterium]
MKKIAVLIFFLPFVIKGWSQETQVRAVVDKMFSAMLQKDTAKLRQCFIPGVQLMTYAHDSKGNYSAKYEQLPDFLRQIILIGDTEIEEVLTGWQCYMDEGMASVWAPYEFFYDGKFSHCGVNSMQLMKVKGEWKITQIADTRRKKDCIRDKEIIEVIDSLVNEWHHAAAVADEKTFFGRMAEDGIYIGTDASERWLRDELAVWSKKYFDREKAWDFTPLSRNIRIAPGAHIAWFDELLSTWMGTCRSTCIMELRDNEWKIVHYQLSVTLPNDKVDGFLELTGKQ